MTQVDKYSLVPYPCVYIDATWRDVISSIWYLKNSSDHRDQMKAALSHIWNSKQSISHLILPCLSVRSAFDLFLNAKRYPPGSEILMTAINIPLMKKIAECHQLVVVLVDITIGTLAPEIELVESLLTDKTVAIVIAHLYGRRSNIDDLVRVCRRHCLAVVEDCAEAFCGFKRVGHPETDLSMFSFGAIKSCTAFGGAIVRVNDLLLHKKMLNLIGTYSIQSRLAYLRTVLRCSVGMIGLNSPLVMRVMLPVLSWLGLYHKEAMISLLKGHSMNSLSEIRQQPSTALLGMMLRRFQDLDEASFQVGREKCNYVVDHLPNSVTAIGKDTDSSNYWLFPVVVNEPDKVVKALNLRGVDAYRGATQLTCLDPRPAHPISDLNTASTYPHQARHLIDHAVYLPVHRRVPYDYLAIICATLASVMRDAAPHPLPVDLAAHVSSDKGQLQLRSKL